MVVFPTPTPPVMADKTFSLIYAVDHRGERLLVTLAEVQELRVGRDMERMFSEVIKLQIHVSSSALLPHEDRLQHVIGTDIVERI